MQSDERASHDEHMEDLVRVAEQVETARQETFRNSSRVEQRSGQIKGSHQQQFVSCVARKRSGGSVSEQQVSSRHQAAQGEGDEHCGSHCAVPGVAEAFGKRHYDADCAQEQHAHYVAQHGYYFAVECVVVPRCCAAHDQQRDAAVVQSGEHVGHRWRVTAHCVEQRAEQQTRDCADEERSEHQPVLPSQIYLSRETQAFPAK